MFKNLRKKLEQGVNQSPLKGALASASKLLDEKQPETSPLAESTPKKPGAANDDGNQSNASDVSGYATANQSMEESPATIPVGQLIDIPLQDTSSESSASNLPGDLTPQASRSRTSSISSMTSDSSFFTNVSFPQHHYSLPSDMESEMDESGTDLNTVSKEDLYHYIQKYQKRATRYKSKFMELVTVYKDMVQERDKFKNTLTQSQDRAFRRISELKEQIQLDQKAKKDLEENYTFVIEEKQEFIKVLQKQVLLLKEGKDIPPDLQEQIQAGKEATQSESEQIAALQAELNSHKDKLKHQDSLLQRCKEIIKSSKDKYSQLSEEKIEVEKQLEDTNMELVKLKGSASPDTVSKLQNQIKQARQVIEQLETDREIAIAEVKQRVHEEMERKDQEVSEIRAQTQGMVEENKNLKEKIEKLEQASSDQLEKSREIIKRLKDDRKRLIDEYEEKLRGREDQMETEKEKLVQEISRGKSAAITLMQEQANKQNEEKVNEALIERDEVWQKKMSDQEMAHQEIVVTKERELQQLQARFDETVEKLKNEKELYIKSVQDETRSKLQEKEQEMQLAMEERDLTTKWPLVYTARHPESTN
ncbi:golgin subfamily A member 4-like [Ruditapes philippinarum]|uniref:golgin subfamily A member 4-like n=1 Tax=Ruditapes philippinarum TaxID=129788 RepID=UPI00295B10A4|nr:golgin subfamily A member 4-like [Ruditapes philippinarum]